MKGLFLAGALAAACAASAQPYRDGDVVVFLGDSITHGGRYHEYITDFYRTRFPEASIRFVNAGISGDTSSGALSRVKTDVAAFDPTHVTVHFGMNDIGRDTYRENADAHTLRRRSDAQKAYRANLKRLVSEVRAAAPRATLTYLTPTPYDEYAVVTNRPKDASGWALANNVGCNTGLSLLAGHVIDCAQADKVAFVDWYSPLNNFLRRHQKGDAHFMITRWDRVHPEELGHSIMAWEFLKAQKVGATVSDVAVDAASGTVAKAENAEVGNVERRADGVSFDVLAKALPFPVHEKALPYVREFDVERTLNREALAVRGLPEGTYGLTIDGEPVGDYSAAELDGGILLGFNVRTPQYRQAQAVLARVAELREREREIRNHHAARWAFRTCGVIDDMAAFAKWCEDDKAAGGKRTDNYYGQFIPGYLAYWPKRDEIRAALWKEQDAVRARARPLRRRYELRIRTAEGANSSDTVWRISEKCCGKNR